MLNISPPANDEMTEVVLGSTCGPQQGSQGLSVYVYIV